ncbi:MAG TPA: hypothetical protein VFS34_04655 [Thermoanaerobaculia bacterium]|nr:hypothetical protein [Thermoanaerobaculia bacterium]
MRTGVAARAGRRRMLSGAFALLLAAGGASAEGIRLGTDAAPGATPPKAPAASSPVYRTGDAALLDSLAGIPAALVRDAGGDPDELAATLKSHPNVESIIFPSGTGPAPEGAALDRLRFEVKRLAATVRGLRPEVRIALSAGLAPGDLDRVRLLLEDPTLVPEIDAVLLADASAAEVRDHPLPGSPELWLDLSPVGGSGTTLVAGLADLAARRAERVFFGSSPDPSFPAELVRAQAYLGPDVSPQPPPSPAHEARFFDAKAVAPILFVEASGPGNTRVDVSGGGPYREAQVENLASGAKRSFALGAGAKFLDLDLASGPAAVRLVPERKPGEVQAQVSVGSVRALTAEEIVAHERAWKATQDDLVRSYTADLTTSLRFRVAEVNETFDLTIEGPLFKERGKDFDWAWSTFYVNGIKWKGKTLPKIPILQPEKVTTLPLEIELGEDYVYSLAGRATVEGRPAWEVDFTPKASAGKKALYRGRAWIDARTFALLRRRSVQVNLTGETLSNVETEFYRPVPGTSAVLPLEIKGEEVFSTAGRTTAIERSVLLKNVRINPPDFSARRSEVYASEKQMVRDTDHGLKYLVPDPASPGGRVVEEYVSKKSLFGVAGFFYDGSLGYPIPLLGVQYFDFDLFHKGKQISTFFAGAVLTTNYTDPAFLGSRFDLGADVVGFAIPFGDASYRDGKEVKDERLKHVPALFQVNVGHPLGPYLKASAGFFAKWDDYQRDPDTAHEFVTPVDTFTFGYEVKLTANVSGFNGVLDYSRFRRNEWAFWGIPGASEFTPAQRDYEKYSASIAKDYYFTGFRKIHAGLTYLSGNDLDRFSRYEFGAFSGNPIRGYQSGALRTRQAWVMNLSYGLNIENIIRLEALYDQAILNDAYSGFHHAYYSGAGISGQLNGPWNNSLIRFDVGVPVVSHGIHGVSASALILKLF